VYLYDSDDLVIYDITEEQLPLLYGTISITCDQQSSTIFSAQYDLTSYVTISKALGKQYDYYEYLSLSGDTGSWDVYYTTESSGYLSALFGVIFSVFWFVAIVGQITDILATPEDTFTTGENWKRFFKNVLFFMTGFGFLNFIVTLAATISCCVPMFSSHLRKQLVYLMYPYGRKLVKMRENKGCSGYWWAIVFGWWLFLLHLLCGVLCIFTVVFIPFGLLHFNMANAVMFLPLYDVEWDTKPKKIIPPKHAVPQDNEIQPIPPSYVRQPGTDTQGEKEYDIPPPQYSND